MKVSVIIPSYVNVDRASGIDRLLLTLKGFDLQTADKDKFEVIVVDDGSIIDLKEAIKDYINMVNLKVIRKNHEGMCSAFNFGINKAMNPIIFIGIDDSIPDRNLIQSVIENHTNKDMKTIYHYKELKVKHAVIFEDIINRELVQLSEEKMNTIKDLGFDNLNIDLDDLETNFDKIKVISSESKYNKENEHYIINGKSNEKWLAVRIGNISINKNFLLNIGGFNEKFDPIGLYADLDLGLRLEKFNGIHKFSNSTLFHLPHYSNYTDEDDLNYLKHLNGLYHRLDVALLPLYFNKFKSLKTYFEYCNNIKPDYYYGK